MSERHWRLFAEDILECIEKIESYVGSMKFEDFKRDGKTIDAVVRNLEIIGEASKHVPNAIREKYRDIYWSGIIGLRNRIIHEYFGVDLHIIWRIIGKDIPALKEQMKRILEKERYMGT